MLIYVTKFAKGHADMEMEYNPDMDMGDMGDMGELVPFQEDMLNDEGVPIDIEMGEPEQSKDAALQGAEAQAEEDKEEEESPEKPKRKRKAQPRRKVSNIEICRDFVAKFDALLFLVCSMSYYHV